MSHHSISMGFHGVSIDSMKPMESPWISVVPIEIHGDYMVGVWRFHGDPVDSTGNSPDTPWRKPNSVQHPPKPDYVVAPFEPVEPRLHTGCHSLLHILSFARGNECPNNDVMAALILHCRSFPILVGSRPAHSHGALFVRNSASGFLC